MSTPEPPIAPRERDGALRAGVTENVPRPPPEALDAELREGEAPHEEHVTLREAAVTALRLLRTLVAASLAGLLVAEGVLRLFGLPEGISYSVKAAYDLDDESVGPFLAGAHVDVPWPPETAFEANFNSLGCRGAEPRDVDAPPILAVGDSLTFGLGVQDDETWPAQLDALLHERGLDRPVVNLSSAFLMIDDELAYLERALPVVKPGIVVLLLPPAGDGGYFVDGRTQHQDGFERERRSRNTHFEFVRELALNEARFYAKVWRRRLRLEGAGEYPPLFLPAAGHLVKPLPPVIERYEAGVEEFRRRVEAAGARLVIASFPQIGMAGDEIEFQPPWSGTLAVRLGLPYADVAGAFAAQPDPASLVLLPYDAHASAAGNRVVAEAVLDTLIAEGLVSGTEG